MLIKLGSLEGSLSYKYEKKKYKTKKVLICDTMPAIELWFLLHYTYTTREFTDCDQVIQELKKYLPDYEKTGSFLKKNYWFLEMVKGESKAINNAENLLLKIKGKNTGVHFPYSRIPEGIKEFERQKKEKNKL